MALPCPKCGGTKTDPVKHGLKYNLAWAFGYRLQQCSRCRTSRYMPKYLGRSSNSSRLGKEPRSSLGFAGDEGDLGSAEARPWPSGDQGTAADPRKRELPRCPACGSRNFHRTKRTIIERLLQRPRMVRCETCGIRFPRPRVRTEYFGPLKTVQAGGIVPPSVEVTKAPKMAEDNTATETAKRVTAAVSADGNVRICPACGGTKSHRTRRTTLERLLQRPPMARCEGCGMRFPYFQLRDKPPDSMKSGEAAARRVGEEAMGSRTSEETSQPNAGEQGTAADSSNRELRCCPFCGSTSFQRSRRTKLEHFLLRPKMARCRTCHKRFPHPDR